MRVQILAGIGFFGAIATAFLGPGLMIALGYPADYTLRVLAVVIFAFLFVPFAVAAVAPEGYITRLEDIGES